MALKVEVYRNKNLVIGDYEVVLEHEDVALIRIEIPKFWRIISYSSSSVELANDKKEREYATIAIYGYKDWHLWSCSLSDEELCLTFIEDTGGY
jgi:hypothetical protein